MIYLSYSWSSKSTSMLGGHQLVELTHVSNDDMWLWLVFIVVPGKHFENKPNRLEQELLICMMTIFHDTNSTTCAWLEATFTIKTGSSKPTNLKDFHVQMPYPRLSSLNLAIHPVLQIDLAPAVNPTGKPFGCIPIAGWLYGWYLKNGWFRMDKSY